MQRGHCAGGNAFAALRCTAAGADSGFACLARGNICLRSFDVPKLQCFDDALAEQRSDMGLDAAAIHLKRGRFDRTATATDDLARFRILQIPVADLVDRRAAALGPLLVGRIFTPCNFAEQIARFLACLFHREDTEAPEHHAAGLPIFVAILKDEAPDAALSEPDAEPAQFGVHSIVFELTTPSFAGFITSIAVFVIFPISLDTYDEPKNLLTFRVSTYL